MVWFMCVQNICLWISNKSKRLCVVWQCVIADVTTYQIGVQDIWGRCRDVPRKDVTRADEQRRNSPTGKIEKSSQNDKLKNTFIG